MSTQLQKAVAGEITPEMAEVAQREGVELEYIRQGVAAGAIVILHNRARENARAVAVGAGLQVKVNASIGWAPGTELQAELAKAEAAQAAGADTLMDLSISGDIDAARRAVLSAATVPVGTLPVYQALAAAVSRYGAAVEMTTDDIFDIAERQAADGVDFLALHCATTRQTIRTARQHGRTDFLVSHGGSHLVGWMLYHQKENPLYEHFNRLLDICRRYDVVLSLADGWRPGCIADSLDAAQVQELVILGELVQRARAAGVQVMVKGPGHVPLGQIKATISLQKELCHGAPYFVFGPVVTDAAPGYDHISAAIGGAVSALAGADFLCYVTAAEHLGLPGIDEVREGVIAARIAAHAADITRRTQARNWDLAMSRARKSLDWEQQIALAIDPARAAALRRDRSKSSTTACAMCGKYCAMQVVDEYLGKKGRSVC